MKLKHVLSTNVVAMNLTGNTKQEIIEELLDLLVKTGKISDRQKALQDMLSREEKMSTGIQYGIAIPHAKTSAVKELCACIGIKKDGVDFQALDGQPSTIFFMTLSPVNKTGPHVQFLAEISLVVKTESARKQIFQAATPQEVLAVFGL
ncbi:MAG: PTS sugar transporter subunit IIA [Spirochaetales bacterium]|jgi:fructose-specific phosphotransferase system IIA component|nr:PTS sugar transporter subunit IIA [Spirochaetales bacterium]